MKLRLRITYLIAALWSVVAHAQFNGLPIPNTVYTWEEANSVGICSQLFEAVDERCVAVGTQYVARPIIIQTFVCDWATDYVIGTNVVGTNTYVYTNAVVLTTNIVTTNCTGPFVYAGRDGPLTAYPPVSQAFIAALDSKVASLLPYFVDTQWYTANKFNDWFSLTNSLGSHPYEYPMLNFPAACSNANIGHIVSNAVATWYFGTAAYDQITNGEAYYTRQPAATNSWVLAEMYYDRADAYDVSGFVNQNPTPSLNGTYYRVDPDNDPYGFSGHGVPFYTNRYSSEETLCILRTSYFDTNRWWLHDAYFEYEYWEQSPTSPSPIGTNWISITGNTNAPGMVTNSTSLSWQFRRLQDFDYRFYDASVKPIIRYTVRQGGAAPAVDLNVFGNLIATSPEGGQAWIPKWPQNYPSVALGDNACGDQWFNVSNMVSSTVGSPGASITLMYTNYVLYGDQPFILNRVHVDERTKVLKQMLWTKNHFWYWTNSLAAVSDWMSEESTNVSNVYTNDYGHDETLPGTAWYAWAYDQNYAGYNPSWNGEDWYKQLLWWTMFFSGEPPIPRAWYAWLVFPHWDVTAGLGAPITVPNQRPSARIIWIGTNEYTETVDFTGQHFVRENWPMQNNYIPDPDFNAGDPETYKYDGSKTHLVADVQSNALIKSTIYVYTNITTNINHVVEWYTYGIYDATNRAPEYFESNGADNSPTELSSWYVFTNTAFDNITQVGTRTAGVSIVGSVYGDRLFYGTNSVSDCWDESNAVYTLTATSMSNKYYIVDASSITAAYFNDDLTYTVSSTFDHIMVSLNTYWQAIAPYSASKRIEFSASGPPWLCTIYLVSATPSAGETIAFTMTNSAQYVIDGAFHWDAARSSTNYWGGTTGQIAYGYNGYEYSGKKWGDTYFEHTNSGAPFYASEPPPYSPVTESNNVYQTNITVRYLGAWRYDLVTNGPPFFPPDPMNISSYLITNSITNIVMSTNFCIATNVIWCTNYYYNEISEIADPPDRYMLWTYSNNVVTNTVCETIVWTNTQALQLYWSGDWYMEGLVWDGGGSAVQNGDGAIDKAFYRDTIDALMKWDVSGGFKRY